MTRKIEYTGYSNPWQNIEGFVRHTLKTNPQIKTQEQVDAVIYRATVERQQRFRAAEGGKVTAFFGADIMSSEPLSNPAWQWLPADWASVVLTSNLEQREKMRTVKGLSRTYIWCWQNEWLQSVTDEDYDLIMTSPYRGLFRDPEIHGLHIEVQSYNHVETEKIAVDSLAEGERVLAERRPKHYVQGADIASRRVLV